MFEGHYGEGMGISPITLLSEHDTKELRIAISEGSFGDTCRARSAASLEALYLLLRATRVNARSALYNSLITFGSITSELCQ
jgi:hypothetical protein